VDVPFLAIIFIVGVLSGATAAVSGFGIGSLMTPLLATRVGVSTAVAAVALPHAIATLVRWWRLRAHVDRTVIRTFGVLSAVGGLAGSLVFAAASSRTVSIILGGLLVITSLAAITEWNRRWSPHGALVGVVGFASGLFGGVAGNQGGLRAAALLSFSLTPLAFVATSTATGLLVDAARTPIYLWQSGAALMGLWQPIGIATLGVLIGTVLGERLLFGLSPAKFRLAIGVLIGALGVWILAQAIASP
jgi:uncharacterized membrane protein YfcA